MSARKREVAAPSARIRRIRWLALACLLGTSLPGCQSILGIEDRELVSETEADGGMDAGGDSGPVGPDGATLASADQCRNYCDTINTGCPDSLGMAPYQIDDYCVATCRHFVTKPGQLMGATFECRLDQATRAASVVAAPGEGETNCKRAGPGGDNTCGSNCENYCALWASVCTGQDAGVPDTDCVNKCTKLRDTNEVNIKAAFGSMSDTVQCRLAHLSAAAFQPDPHCEHSSLNPLPGPCNPDAPSCKDYCTVLMNTCSATEVKQYDSVAECESACDKLLDKTVPSTPKGVRDIDQDSVACRKYHVMNALTLSNVDHCYHAGFGGDGHCGEVCPVYCKLAKKACGTQFDSRFKSDEECLSDCATVLGQTDTKLQRDYKYSTAVSSQLPTTPGGIINCRFNKLVKSISNPTACGEALGVSGCK